MHLLRSLYAREDQEAFPYTGGIVNGTCTKERSSQDGPPLFQSGGLNFQAHDVGWIVCAFFSLVATFASFWLIGKHLKWYTNKREQRFIVRILFMVPIYTWVSFGSYVFWNHATPLLLLRDCYESTVLTAFFYLLLVYISPEPAGQRDVMRRVGMSVERDAELRRKGSPPDKWAFPLFWIKSKPADGMYFLQLMKWGILQYCVLRPLTTLAAVVLDYMGLYCETSYSPAWGHIYLTAIVSVSVTIAMYCLLQLYFTVSDQLKPKQPLLKLFAIKAVVFLTFWQATGLGFLITFNLIKNTTYMTADDINTGIGAILECFEMMVFAFVHVKAFSYRPYRPAVGPDGREPTPTPKMRALGHALDYRETFREIWAGMVYMGHRMRGVETEGDRIARRQGMLEVAMGKGRTMPSGQSQWNLHGGEAESLDVRVDVEEESYDTAGERQWLGVGDPYRARREKSEALEDQIERELKKKGYSMRKEPTAATHGHHPRGASSWWRRAFDRFSYTGSDVVHPPTQPADEAASPGRRRARPSRSRGRDKVSRDFKTPLMTTYEYDDPPPQSTLHGHRGRPRMNPPANQWSGPILTYEERMQLSPISPISPESPRHAVAMASPEYNSRSDPMLARMFPLDDVGRRSKQSPLPPLPPTAPAPGAHETHWAARERRWTFGSDGPLNAIAAPASPRSSQDSAFHTARDTLGSSCNPSTAGSRRMSYDGGSSQASSGRPNNEFGYGSRSRRSPAEHLHTAYDAPRPPRAANGRRTSQDIPPPHPSPLSGMLPLSPPYPTNAGGRDPRGGTRSPRTPMVHEMPRHGPKKIVFPAPLAGPAIPAQHTSTDRRPRPTSFVQAAPGPSRHDPRFSERPSFDPYPR